MGRSRTPRRNLIGTPASNPEGIDRDRTPQPFCSDDDDLPMAQEVEDSDPSDGEWSEPTYSDASRSPSPPLKSIPTSHHPAVKRKASTPLDSENEPRIGTKRCKVAPPISPEVASTILQLLEDTPDTREACFLLRTPIIWTTEQFDAYWPLVDNFWVCNKPNNAVTGKGLTFTKGPIQKLMVGQLKKAMEAQDEGEIPRNLNDELSCTCLLYRQYQLPCSHLWQFNRMRNAFAEADWKRWAYMFEEGGFEIYESATKEYVTRDIYDKPDGPSKHMLDVREVLDEIKSKFYELEAGTAKWEDDVRERISAQWVAMLQMTGPIRQRGAQEALQELANDAYNIARLEVPPGWKDL